MTDRRVIDLERERERRALLPVVMRIDAEASFGTLDKVIEAIEAIDGKRLTREDVLCDVISIGLATLARALEVEPGD